MPEGTRWTVPAGGFYSWVTLPDGLDATAMLPRAVAALVAYVPGTGFYADGQGRAVAAAVLLLPRARPDPRGRAPARRRHRVRARDRSRPSARPRAHAEREPARPPRRRTSHEQVRDPSAFGSTAAQGVTSDEQHHAGSCRSSSPAGSRRSATCRCARATGRRRPAARRCRRRAARRRRRAAARRSPRDRPVVRRAAAARGRGRGRRDPRRPRPRSACRTSARRPRRAAAPSTSRWRRGSSPRRGSRARSPSRCRTRRSASSVPRAVLDAVVGRLGLPLMVKPTRGGSSLGATVVRDRRRTCPPRWWPLRLRRHRAHRAVRRRGPRWPCPSSTDDGGPRALPVVEVVPDGGFYDYGARYTAGATEFFTPARLPDAVLAACAATARDRARGRSACATGRAATSSSTPRGRRGSSRSTSRRG